MAQKSTRRDLLVSGSRLGLLASAGPMSFLAKLPRVRASETQLDPQVARFGGDIEPWVRLLEETPRKKVIGEVAREVKSGHLTYRELVAAILLAGVRNVQPRPSVGFKFHAVLVVNSAHLASLASPDSDRWLPIFWAVDNFKASQDRDVREGDWTMGPVNEAAVPAAHLAKDAFVDAMDQWDVEAADAAVVSLARSAGRNELFELFARYGCRDFRSIGHKAIFVANSFRTLDSIGWQYGEPVLRSLAYALLNHQGEPNPAKSDLGPDRPGRVNRELVGEIRSDWLGGRVDAVATRQLMDTIREGSSDDASQAVVELINEGISPQSVLDALYLASGEMLMRQPGIVGLHTLTTTNALNYAFRTCQTDETRRLLLLQNASFLTLFMSEMKRRGKVADREILDLKAESLVGDAEGGGAGEVLADISENRMVAARKLLGLLQSDPSSAKRFIDEARRTVFLKGSDSHDYKFSSAVLEDYYHVSPDLRDRFLASSVFNLKSTRANDRPLVSQIREALS